jgi:hypothetical protein
MAKRRGVADGGMIRLGLETLLSNQLMLVEVEAKEGGSSSCCSNQTTWEGGEERRSAWKS